MEFSQRLIRNTSPPPSYWHSPSTNLLLSAASSFAFKLRIEIEAIHLPDEGKERFLGSFRPFGSNGAGYDF